jgi:predicted metal-binding membrane protein
VIVVSVVGVDQASGVVDDRAPVRTPWWVVVVATGGAWVAIVVSGAHDHRAHASVTLPAVLVAWALMVVAMMTPTLVPMLSTLASILAGRRRSTWWLFLAGYLAVWTVAAAVGAVIQWAVANAPSLDGATARRLTVAGVLALAAGYQFTSWKARCLTACTNPINWFMRHWRDGAGGAWRMGLRHGVVCVGCCWALMALMTVGVGAGIVAMVALTAVMIVEKLPSVGQHVRVPLGVVLALTALTILVDPAAGSDDHRNHQIPTTQAATHATEQGATWTPGRSPAS